MCEFNVRIYISRTTMIINVACKYHTCIECLKSIHHAINQYRLYIPTDPAMPS